MLKTLLSNPVSRTFIALIIAVLAVLGAFLTYVTAPESFGETAIRFETDTIYYFADDWSLAYDYLEFDFPPGTLVIPGYHQGRVVAVLLISPGDNPGDFTLSLPRDYRGDLPGSIQDSLDQALLMLNYTDYNKLFRDSGDTILLRAQDVTEEQIPQRYILRQMDNGYNLLVNYDLYGFTNWLLPGPQTALARFWGQRLGTLTYYEDTQVKVSSANFEINFSHPGLEESFYPPGDYQTRAGIYIVFLGLAAAGLIAFLCGGLENQHYKLNGEYQPLWTILALFGAMLYACLLAVFDVYFQPPTLGLAALWALPLALVGIWAHQAHLTPDFFGLTRRGLVSGVISALFVSIFIALGATFTLPTGITGDTSLALSLGLMVLLREALLRGFCQRILSHWLHPLLGLLLVSSLWAAIVVFTGPTSGALLPWLSALGKSLLIGYLYYRSNNLLATGLLAALLEIAAVLLIY